MDSDLLGLLMVIGAVVLAFLLFGFLYTVWVAAREAHNWFARENERARMQLEEDEW